MGATQCRVMSAKLNRKNGVQVPTELLGFFIMNQQITA